MFVQTSDGAAADGTSTDHQLHTLVPEPALLSVA
jgi:hypothetical protein